MNWIIAGGISSGILGFLVYAVSSLITRNSHLADQQIALNNGKHLALMLFEFETEYGRYPDASTAAAVKAKTHSTLSFGDGSSNQIFRQLLVGASDSPASEKPFWTKSAASSRKEPDNIFNSDATALAAGEVGFSYIAGLSLSSDPASPVLLAPLVPGKREFDPKPFKGKAVIVSNDSSAKFHPIDQHGRVMINGMDLFDPKQPFWKGRAPDVKWPE